MSNIENHLCICASYDKSQIMQLWNVSSACNNSHIKLHIFSLRSPTHRREVLYYGTMLAHLTQCGVKIHSICPPGRGPSGPGIYLDVHVFLHSQVPLSVSGIHSKLTNIVGCVLCLYGIH